MRPVLPLLTAVALVATLAACSAQPNPEPTASATVDVCATPTGGASKEITAKGDFGTEPTVTFEKGLSTDKTERTVLIQGDGPELAAGGTARVSYVAYNAASGAQIDSYGYAEGESSVFTASTNAVLTGIAKTIGCVAEGSRVVSIVPPAEGFGTDGYADLGVAAGDSIIFVMDVTEVLPTSAWGKDQPAETGFPTVSLTKDGTPTVTIPESDAPTELSISVLKKGDGPAVAAEGSAIVQYLGVNWATGEAFSQSWGTGPVAFVLTDLIPGLEQALAGQTVGSQVLVVVPAALAYGEKSDDNTSDLAGQTLAFVVDILALG